MLSVSCRTVAAASLRALHLRTAGCRTILHSGTGNGGGSVVHRRLVIDGRPVIHRRLVIDGRPVVHRRLVIDGRPVVHRRFVIDGRPVVHRRFRLVSRGLMHGRSGSVVHRRSRHAPRMMPRRTMRRHAHAVHVVRIMPVAMVPGRRGPVRHQTGCRDGGNGENGRTRRGVTIHRPAVIITINREAIHIVPGICPGHCSAADRAAHADGCAGIHGVIIHNAGIQQQGRTCKQGNITQLRFHGFMWLSEW